MAQDFCMHFAGGHGSYGRKSQSSGMVLHTMLSTVLIKLRVYATGAGLSRTSQFVDCSLMLQAHLLTAPLSCFAMDSFGTQRAVHIVISCIGSQSVMTSRLPRWSVCLVVVCHAGFDYFVLGNHCHSDGVVVF